ncbi:MAG: zinc ribbon domain-containing protein [Deltaproteobacteria bacterium]|nr:zinc ribbon domain-containing protein [Deltaproteobacteria bacterium]MBW2120201.1 zinc ribbon domain-containing protein [Deltaproteobacteria bacterium]MBW2345342.1 zinc ribbon domain-containing protein [Deltaproteobacteria bacterium]
MFFFIAGIQPKTVKLDDHPRMCPSCGLYQARLKRVDQYISVFFLPIFRVKQGIPFVECQSCGSFFQESGEVFAGPSQRSVRTCPNCGKPLEPEHRFCPFCGKSV